MPRPSVLKDRASIFGSPRPSPRSGGRKDGKAPAGRGRRKYLSLRIDDIGLEMERRPSARRHLQDYEENDIKMCQEEMRKKFNKMYKQPVALSDADLHLGEVAPRHRRSIGNANAIAGKGHQRRSKRDTTSHKTHRRRRTVKKEKQVVEDVDEEEAALLGHACGIPPEMQEIYDEAHTLVAVQKLSLGHHEDLTVDDVSTLFESMQPNDEGQLQLERIHILLTHCLEPPCNEEEVEAMLQHFPTHVPRDWSDVYISDTQLFNAFTRGPDVEKFRRLRALHHPELTRDDLLRHVSAVVDRHDYFKSLPMAVVNLLVFTFFFISHLRIYDRSKAENAMEEYVNGRDPRETCTDNVDDIDRWWWWIGNTGLNGAFGNEKPSGVNPDYPHFLVAARNVLVGDVRIVQEMRDGTASTVWLLHSPAGANHLAANPGKYLDAAQAASLEVQNEGGLHPNIRDNYLQYVTYNEQAKLFASISVHVHLGDYGEVRPKINVGTASIEPYAEVGVYVIDAIFVGLTLLLIHSEGKQVFVALRLGCGEFFDYWEFWNVVDWMQIACRVWMSITWGLCYFAMNHPDLIKLLDDEGKLKVNVMALTQTETESIYDAVETLRLNYLLVQIVSGVNTVVVIATFFKGFNSNARLKVVQATFISMFEDIIHFFIIFSTIFLPFILIGHIIFGQDLPEFSSATMSINTGIMLLMGEYGWYADLEFGRPLLQLRSGKYVIGLLLWYITFVVLVVLVLLNMVIAIILEHYLELSKLMHDDPEAPPIWTQIGRYREFKNDTKGFIKLEQMLAMLENDADPAHHQHIVCANSLLNAWPTMSQHQAIWLMCWLEKKKQMDEDRRLHADDDDHFQSVEEDASDKIKEIYECIIEGRRPDTKEGNRLSQAHSKHVQKTDTDVARIEKVLKDVQLGLQKMKREQDRLARRCEQLHRVMPPKPSLLQRAGTTESAEMTPTKTSPPEVGRPAAKSRGDSRVAPRPRTQSAPKDRTKPRP